MIRTKLNFKLDGAKACVLDVFTYSTVRSATIQSKNVGIVYRFAQLLILIYIIWWDLILNKGYQTFESVSSVVTTKVKGQGYVPLNKSIDMKLFKSDKRYLEKQYELDSKVEYKILDTADYVIPPNEYNSIFIMTNFIRTDQGRGSCDEEPNKYKAKCESDYDCQKLGPFMSSWNGMPTGKCVNSTFKPSTKVCEIKGWCPLENDAERHEDNMIRNTLNYTIFIKNDIEFKKFKKKQRNILPNITNQYISKCNYDDHKDPYCPVFKVDYILNKAESDKEEKFEMLTKGGVIQILIEWNCNLDVTKDCLPKYSFRRFDIPFKQTTTSSGFNFRYADKYKIYGTEQRILYKAFGLRFIISVTGIAGKFDVMPLMLTIGAGFGLMSLSVIIADCVMLHCTKDRNFFKKMKELDLKENTVSPDLPTEEPLLKTQRV